MASWSASNSLAGVAKKSTKPDVLLRFGDRLKSLRAASDLSQEAFADKCELDRTYISGIERGRRNVGLRNLEAIAKALDLSLEDMLAGV